MSTRTDIHRPSAEEFNPEGYAYEGAFDLHPEGMDAQFRILTVNRLLGDGYRFTGVHGMGSCDHCGARVRYTALMSHAATKGLIWIGEQCLSNRFESGLSASDFRRLRETARLNRERATREEQERAKFAAALSALTEDAALDAFAWAQTDDAHPIAADIAGKAPIFGPLSERQAAFLVKLHTEAQEKAAAKQTTPEAHQDCPAGKQTIRGTVKSTKAVQGFGRYAVDTIKMLVEDDRGFRVWGTAPEALLGAAHQDEENRSLKGHRVEFTATVQPKDEDPTFGFFSRPTKARLIDQEPATEPAPGQPA